MVFDRGSGRVTAVRRVVHCTSIAMMFGWLVVGADLARAASAFLNEVVANGENGYTLCNHCDLQAPISTATPNTIFHPNPINGYGSIQGVDVGPQNGAGLTVNAAVDLPLGSTFATSKSTAFVEFTIDQVIPFNNDPVDILIRGAYGFTDGGTVEAVLWNGFRNCEFCSGTQRQVLLRTLLDTPNLGIWEANVQLRPHAPYTMKLVATAGAADVPSTFIPSSRAFIDPVLTTVSGEPLTINFDSGTLTSNPNFVPPMIVPEPAGWALISAMALLVIGGRTRR